MAVTKRARRFGRRDEGWAKNDDVRSIDIFGAEWRIANNEVRSRSSKDLENRDSKSATSPGSPTTSQYLRAKLRKPKPVELLALP